LVPAAAVLSWLNRRSGRLADRIGFKPVIMIGFGLFIIGWAGLLLFSSFNSIWIAIICSIIIESGNAFAMMPATTLGANSLTNDLIPHGSSLQSHPQGRCSVVIMLVDVCVRASLRNCCSSTLFAGFAVL